MIFEAIFNRRSVRKFKDVDVEDQKVRRILEAAVWAPSGGNIQPWRFIVIKDKELMELVKMFSPGLLGSPPLIIAVCSDREEARQKGGKLGEEYLSIVDCAMAV